MKRRIFRFLSILTLCTTMIFGGAAAAPEANNPDIGDYGAWLTEHNLNEYKRNISHDLNEFEAGAENSMDAGYVPIEARLGISFMNAMTYVGKMLNNSLLRFMMIFLIIAYLFWAAFESYNVIIGKGKLQDTAKNIFKKGLLISVWLIVLQFGPAQIFMWLMGPILSFGTFMSDMILNAVTTTIGRPLPDTCAAIHAYAYAHAAPDMLISAQSGADIMCVPTRMSGFFYTGIAVGLKWMLVGITTSALTFVVGLAFVILFSYNMWKFALIAFGVIADLFLAIFMLPFTAVAETIDKTSYKGVAGNIFNSFLGLFNTSSVRLQPQITRFINAALYFVSLSIVVGLCAALMSTFATATLASSVPSVTSTDFLTAFLTGLLVAYIVHKADDIVADLGGEIDRSMANKVQGDLKTLRKDATNLIKKIRAAAKKKAD